ncbi:sirohydrochlorin chelatase [Haoranjiania flava]|uniref:CbiX/SirB N-terminal domain-containing protein n=1 Tax=Haoranjiania flava TaxID=1856322 RepID=A0AAE3IM21_9BACT|nr:CbiX/SirB N-terminal domain-containing protein [Haoranjiania flava]MCU7694368.1 CbiX/SirB N-terminal domain-containing protein [Haoranjiania flava]
MHKKYIFYIIAASFLIITGMAACKPGNSKDNKNSGNEKRKTGLLLVNHGSRSATWRSALLDLEKNISPQILNGKKIEGIKTAFMEYNEPSIATQMKAFDDEGFTDVIVTPIFLTVSPHSFEDIPTILGQKEDPKSMEMLKIEKIARYTPKAKVHITPLLDFTEVLEKNVLRRMKELSENPAEEGVVLIGYGDETYEKEWEALFRKVGKYLQDNAGIDHLEYAWCGHIAHYSSGPTTNAINKILRAKKKAIVIPVLVAFDENFQLKIIGGGVEKVKDYKQRVMYKPDAILPDANVERWAIDITNSYADKVMQ